MLHVRAVVAGTEGVIRLGSTCERHSRARVCRRQQKWKTATWRTPVCVGRDCPRPEHHGAAQPSGFEDGRRPQALDPRARRPWRRERRDSVRRQGKPIHASQSASVRRPPRPARGARERQRHFWPPWPAAFRHRVRVGVDPQTTQRSRRPPSGRATGLPWNLIEPPCTSAQIALRFRASTCSERADSFPPDWPGKVNALRTALGTVARKPRHRRWCQPA